MHWQDTSYCSQAAETIVQFYIKQREFIGRTLGIHRLTRKAAKPGLEMGRN